MGGGCNHCPREVGEANVANEVHSLVLSSLGSVSLTSISLHISRNSYFFQPFLVWVGDRCQPETSTHAAHEKLLVKALLQRKLSHAFSKEELGRLKQKGVYKEAEHEKLEAERLLVTRQVRDERRRLSRLKGDLVFVV